MTKKEQVARAMRRLIADGHWHIGESVGDLFKLEQESERLFGVRASFGTIRAAEQVLVDEGLLSPVQPGVPTRVIAVPASVPEQPLLAALRAVDTRLGEAQSMLRELMASVAS